jgi:hypothetical protein
VKKKPKKWDVFIPPEPPPKPARPGGRPGFNGQTNTAPARALPAMQRIIQRAEERRAVKKWNVARGPSEALENFYVGNSKEVGVCLIREAPDSRHPLVYVTKHPAESHGIPLAWCVECKSRDCNGCVWALKSFRSLLRGESDAEGFARWQDAVAADERLPF